MVEAADNIVALIRNNMAQWKTVLTSDGIKLWDVSIKRGIFQEDSLSPLPVCSNHDTPVNNTRKYESWIHNEKEHYPNKPSTLFG